jgi:(p)ppGpp synthase/HD superfamily hydrolase
MTLNIKEQFRKFMKNKELEDNAFKIAARAHDGQIREDNGEPYIHHPTRVANILKKWFYDDSDLIAAAYCHDILEDCPLIKPSELNSVIGDDAFYLVEQCTNPSKDLPNLTRAEKKEVDRNHIAGISTRAKCLKLADRTNNLQDTCHSKDKEWAKTYVQESMKLYSVLAGTHYELELLFMETLLKAANSVNGKIK